jgi:hypothetical protein
VGQERGTEESALDCLGKTSKTKVRDEKLLSVASSASLEINNAVFGQLMRPAVKSKVLSTR